MRKYLYHGSHILIQDDYLQPHTSFDFKSLVYATDNLAYAIMRCGNFNVEDIAIKEDYVKNKFVIVELRENAFKDIFDTNGYLYYVNKKDFTKQNEEYVSDFPAKIYYIVGVPNIWNTMCSNTFVNNYWFVNFKDSDKYFKDNNIDKEAYLKRRKERIDKIKEIKHGNSK